MSAVNGPKETFQSKGIASAVTICANQKRFRAPPSATPAGLSAGTQSEIADQWQVILETLAPVTTGHGMYAGRAFGLVRDLAANRSGCLYIISAGLGLIDGSGQLPAYGLTVARGVTESIADRITGTFDPVRWFSRLMDGRFAVGWHEVFQPNNGRVLVALTRPYAEMVGPSLAELPADLLARLRIFGAGLSPCLPASVGAQLLPYDERLDTLLPGTKSDFAQRALVHFADRVATGAADLAEDTAGVVRSLSALEAPTRPVRSPATDADLLKLIRARLSPSASASRLLRQLRDEDLVACEQARFAKLFRQVMLEGQVQ